MRTVPTAFLLAGGTLLLWHGLTLSAAAMAAEADSRPPNIVLIVSDDQGYADLGCFGSRDIKTPHLDRLAREGIRCTSFYVAWPACTPSRGSLLTGRYPQRNGLYDMIRNDLADTGYRYDEQTYAVSPERILGMDVREIMISQVLKDTGYATGVFGKWDGGQLKRYLPLQRGFDAYFGFPNTGIDYYTHERYGVPSMYRGNEPIQVEGYATELFKNAAVKFIEDHHRHPFFLYVPFNAPHGASNFERTGPQVPGEYVRQTYPNRDPKNKRSIYMGCVTYMDDCIGQIVATLEKQQVLDKTLIVFFSDNGGSGAADNGPLRGRKAQMFEGGIRVPFVARLPERIPAGSVSDEFLTALELFPTFTRLAGGELSEDVVYDGFDMLPVLAGKEPSSRQEMFWQRRNDRAARVGKWKWVESAKGNGLFDLQSDLGEKRDLSQERPEVLARVQARFAHWQQTMQAAEPRGPFRDY